MRAFFYILFFSLIIIFCLFLFVVTASFCMKFFVVVFVMALYHIFLQSSDVQISIICCLDLWTVNH